MVQTQPVDMSDLQLFVIDGMVATICNEVGDVLHCADRAIAHDNDDHLYEALGHIRVALRLLASIEATITAALDPTDTIAAHAAAAHAAERAGD